MSRTRHKRNIKWVNPHDLAISLPILEHYHRCLCHPKRFNAFRRLREMAKVPLWNICPECGNQLRDTAGNLPALSCGHRQDILPVFSAPTSSAHPGGISNSFANVCGTFRKVPKTSDTYDDPTCSWSLNCHREARWKQLGSFRERTEPV